MKDAPKGTASGRMSSTKMYKTFFALAGAGWIGDSGILAGSGRMMKLPPQRAGALFRLEASAFSQQQPFVNVELQCNLFAGSLQPDGNQLNPRHLGSALHRKAQTCPSPPALL